MKKHLIAVGIMLVFGVDVLVVSKPDYVTRNVDGSVKTRGVYQVDDAARVLKFTVYGGTGDLLYTEVPYYAPDGRLIRCDTLDSSGKLKSVAVFFDSFAKILDADGNVIATHPIENEPAF